MLWSSLHEEAEQGRLTAYLLFDLALMRCCEAVSTSQ